MHAFTKPDSAASGVTCGNLHHRWLLRRRQHELAWTISLALFALGSGALWWAESAGWSLGAFRVF